MLTIEDINVYYGNIQALRGVSLTINQGEIVTLIGANGAGKSTMLKTISGLLKPKQGKILYEKQSIGGKPAQSIVKMGISHVPEGRRVFA
ncbi:MAG: ATP-binding cassette domain-containing protein, partial [Peribacillus sp.]